MDEEKLNAANKYNIIQYALRTNNVSQTCKTFGISRTIFYRWYRDFKKYGMDGLKSKERKDPNMPNRVNSDTERIILEQVIICPQDGPKRIYYELKSQGINVGETGIYNVLKRNRLSRKEERIAFSKKHLSKNEVAKKERKKEINLKNIENSYPGYAILQTTNYLGNVNKIGRVYQIMIYDLNSKFALGRLYSTKSSINAMEFMKMKVFPIARTLEIPMDNIITNNSMEYSTNWEKGTHKYDEFLKENHINHYSYPLSNKAVFGPMQEFLSLLHEEFYKDAFKEKKYENLEELEKGLMDYLRCYNYERPIRDGKYRGKTPTKVILDYYNNGESLPLWIYLRSKEF